MWNIDPKHMCRKHLLGEHLEMHMFVGSINKKISMKGYLEKGFLEIHNLKKRHDALVEEMKKRGYNHKSPLPVINIRKKMGKVNVIQSYQEIVGKCKECRKQMSNLNKQS